MEEQIEALIRIYKSSATNLRKVAELAPEESVVAKTSQAKANTYDLVIRDLEELIDNREENRIL